MRKLSFLSVQTGRYFCHIEEEEGGRGGNISRAVRINKGKNVGVRFFMKFDFYTLSSTVISYYTRKEVK
jgi:hypothetical protein